MSDKLKAAALTAATKGLSRVQAERATANATRNVNAYGQKEEGPSRWQEKKEAKTQMYLKSTEKQATLNQKRCQKCKENGHWTSECQKPEKKSDLDIKALFSQSLDVTEVKKDKKKKKKDKEKGSNGRKKKRKERCRSSSDSDSDSDSDLSDSDSDDRRSRKRKKHSRR